MTEKKETLLIEHIQADDKVVDMSRWEVNIEEKKAVKIKRKINVKLEEVKFDVPDTPTDFNTYSNEKCVNDCIRKGNHFCLATGTTRWGRCCKSKEDCPQVNYCSFEASPTANSLQLWSCPFQDLFCGRQEVLTAYT